MKYKVILTALFLFGFVILLAQNNQKIGDNEKLAIKNVLIEAYVEGIYVNLDSLAVKKGFHPEFLMHVYHNNRLIRTDLGTWLARISLILWRVFCPSGAPGPAVLYIIARSVDQGWMAGVISALGIGLGTLCHILAAAFGVSTLLVTSAMAFNIV